MMKLLRVFTVVSCLFCASALVFPAKAQVADINSAPAKYGTTDQPINFTFEGAWSDEAGENYGFKGWQSGAAYLRLDDKPIIGDASTIVATGVTHVFKLDDVNRPGGTGSHAASIQVEEISYSRKTGILQNKSFKFRAGTMTTGLLHTSENGNNIDMNASYFAAAENSVFHKFTTRPDSIVFFAKTSGMKGRSAQMSLYITDGDLHVRLSDGQTSNAKVIGSAIMEIKADNAIETDETGWGLYGCKITYDPAVTAEPQYLLLSFTAGPSLNSNNLTLNDELQIDDILFIYTPSLSIGDLKDSYTRHGGNTQDIKIPYTISGTFSPFVFNPAPENKVIAYLSDIDGTITEDAAHKVGEITSARPDSLTIRIPAGQEDGTYTLRLVTTNPRFTAEKPITLYREWSVNFSAKNAVFGNNINHYVDEVQDLALSGNYRHGTKHRITASLKNSYRDVCGFFGWKTGDNVLLPFLEQEDEYEFVLTGDTTILAIFDTLYKLQCVQHPGAQFHFDNLIPADILTEITVRRAQCGSPLDTAAKLHIQVRDGFDFNGILVNTGAEVPDTIKPIDMTPDPYNPSDRKYAYPILSGAVFTPLLDTQRHRQTFIVSSSVEPDKAYTKLGSVSVQDSVYRHFDTLSVTARSVNSLYSHFVHWVDLDEDKTTGISTDTVLKLMVEKAGHYAAVFKEDFHTVSVAVDPLYPERGRGQLNKNPEQTTVTHSALDIRTVSVQAIPAQGFSFSSWQVKYNNQSAAPWSKADTLILKEGHLDADYELTARFDTSVHTLSILKPNPHLNGLHNNGTVTGMGEYKYGDSVMLTAAAAPGYHFVKWQLPFHDSLVSKDTVWVQVFSDTVITALFEPNQYKINLDYGDKNLGYISHATGYYKHFDTLKLVATAYKEVGEFRFWLVNGDTVGTEAAFNYVVTDSADIYAIFLYRRCRVEAVGLPAANGTVTVKVNGEVQSGTSWLVNWGDTVEFKAEAWVDDTIDGYEFAGWLTPGGDTVYEANFRIDSITCDTSLTALFPAKVYEMNVLLRNPDYGYAYVGDTSLHRAYDSIAYNEEVRLTAIAKDGFEFYGWYNNGAANEAEAVCFSRENPYTFLMGNANTTVYAWFRDLRYEINLTPVPKTGGVVKGAGMYTKSKDPLQPTIISIEAVANPGYRFLGWYEDTVQKYNEWRAKADFPLEKSLFWIARFEALSSGLKLMAEPEEAVDSLSGEGSYLQDYNARVYAFIKEGYELEDWKNAAGEKLSDHNPYLHTFKGQDTLTAVLRHKALRVDFDIQPSLCGEVEMPVCRYNEPTLAKALPAYGYRLACWLDGRGDTVKDAGGEVYEADELSILSTVDTSFTAVFTPKEYKVEVEYDTLGGEVSGDEMPYEYYTFARLKVCPARHHIFDGWYDALDGRLLGMDTVLDLRVLRDMRIEARFKRTPTFSVLRAVPPHAGFILNAGAMTGDSLRHGCGQMLMLTAEAFEGYEFKTWCVIRDGDTNYVFDMARGISLLDSSTVLALFDTLEYEIEAAVNPAASGTVSGTGVARYGSWVSLQAVPSSGYSFVAYKNAADGRILSYEARYVFLADTSMRVVAEFDTACYELTVVAEDDQGVTSGSGLYRLYDKVPVSAWNMNRRKNFKYWASDKAGTEVLSRLPDYVFVLDRAQNDTIYAFFEWADVELSLSVNNRQMGSVKGDGNYVSGSLARLTALSRNGYHLEGWYENGFSIGSSDTLYLEMTSDREIEAVFAPNRLSVRLKAVTRDGTEVDSVEMHGEGEYDFAQNIYIEITSVPFGYKFVEWRAEDGNTLSKSAAYTRSLQMNRIIYAVLEKEQFHITAKTVGDGLVSGTGYYDKGARVELQAQSRDNWKFKNWRFDGMFYSWEPVIRFEAYLDEEMEAVFEWDGAVPSPFVSMDEAGGVYTLVSKSDEQDKALDDEVVLRAVPNPGYDFLYWVYQGDSVLTTDREILVRVSETTKITAHFQKSIYQIRLSALQPDAVVSLSGTGSYRYGDKVHLKAALKDGYEFKGWYRNVEGGFVLLSEEADFEFEIEAGMDIEARVVEQ